MNKYLEALEHINMKMYYGYCSKCDVNTKAKGNERLVDELIKEKCSKCDLKKDFNTLQELIDKYSKLKSEIIDVEKLSDSRWEEVKRYEKVIDNLNEYISKLEKALDKACKVLERELTINLENGNTLTSTKEEWKTYLLKESEKQ